MVRASRRRVREVFGSASAAVEFAYLSSTAVVDDVGTAKASRMGDSCTLQAV